MPREWAEPGEDFNVTIQGTTRYYKVVSRFKPQDLKESYQHLLGNTQVDQHFQVEAFVAWLVSNGYIALKVN